MNDSLEKLLLEMSIHGIERVVEILRGHPEVAHIVLTTSKDVSEMAKEFEAKDEPA